MSGAGAGVELVRRDRRRVWHPFTQEHTAPPPLAIARGEGAVLEDLDGERYLDLISSWWVTIHGHAHPAIVAAIARQAATLEQVIFAGCTHAPAVNLADALAARLPGDLERVFYSDDGSTAVEVALKLALQYWANRGEHRTRLLAFAGGYHGDTVGAMSVGRGSGFFGAFEPLMFPVEALPFPATWEGDDAVAAREAAALDALDRALADPGGEVAAVILEPLVQGAGGMAMCRPGFVAALCARARAAGALVIFDEVMTGFGRTGTLFAMEQCAVVPDLVCLSKGLTGGFLPLAATVCREGIYREFLGDTFDRAFTHGHSFTANPLGCAAGLASLELFTREDSLAAVARIERRHRGFLERLADHPRAARPRVRGSILAFDVVAGESGYGAAVGPWLKAFFLDRGLLLRPLGDVVYLLPPFCIGDEQLDRAYAGLLAALDALP